METQGFVYVLLSSQAQGGVLEGQGLPELAREKGKENLGSSKGCKGGKSKSESFTEPDEEEIIKEEDIAVASMQPNARSRSMSETRSQR